MERLEVANLMILGSGGHARACMDAMPPELARSVTGYVSPEPGDLVGLPHLGRDEDLVQLGRANSFHAFVAIGPNGVRSAATRLCHDAGIATRTIVSPTAQVGTTAELGDGTIAMHRTVVGAAARIGAGCIVNTGATVDHDCVLGEFVHLAPGVNLAGGCSIGDRSFIGIGASVVPGVTIGRDVTVGAGAVVLHDVADGITVVGVPARMLVR